MGKRRGRSEQVRARCAQGSRRGQPTLRLSPLRHGDVRTIGALFKRLSEQSRRARFNGPKPCLTGSELRQLAAVDLDHHVIVAHLEGDPQAVGVGRLVRDGDSAEIALAVVDDHQQALGIGSTLASELIAHARAIGVKEITALVASENRAALALLRRVPGALEILFEGAELSIRANLNVKAPQTRGLLK